MSAARPYIPRHRRAAPAAYARFPQDRKRQLRVWWREIDRVLLVLVLLLMAIGSIAVAAASPASARRLSTRLEQLDDLYFFWLHLRWQVLGAGDDAGASSRSRASCARRGAILLGAAHAACWCWCR